MQHDDPCAFPHIECDTIEVVTSALLYPCHSVTHPSINVPLLSLGAAWLEETSNVAPTSQRAPMDPVHWVYPGEPTCSFGSTGLITRLGQKLFRPSQAYQAQLQRSAALESLITHAHI
jgi:hypothetical protein